MTFRLFAFFATAAISPGVCSAQQLDSTQAQKVGTSITGTLSRVGPRRSVVERPTPSRERLPLSSTRQPAPASLQRRSIVDGLRDWQDLVGAILGGFLAFLEAMAILWAERSHAQRTAIRTVQTTVRLYRGHTLALLEMGVMNNIDKLSSEQVYDNGRRHFGSLLACPAALKVRQFNCSV